MKSPFFYSNPPAGHEIPITAIARSIKRIRENPSGKLVETMQILLGSRHMLYLSSGRAALWLILKALSNINPKKREVIIPAYTCPAVISALLKANLKPVLCDINNADYGFSGEGLQRKINKDTLAAIIVHLFGYPANIEEVNEYCKEYDAFVIEDAAQAFGNTLLNCPGRKLGLLGDAGFFSFGRGKPISVFHGGIFTTNRDEVFQEASKVYNNLDHHMRFQDLKYGLMLCSYEIFSNPYLYWIPQRIPFLRLGETIFEPNFTVSQGIALATSLVIEMMGSIEKEKEIRKKNSQWYSRNLGVIPEVQRASSPEFPYLRYPLIVKDRKVRDRILERLKSYGTGAALFYPCPLNELPGLKEILQDTNIYPNAKKLSDSLITLPVHSGVTAYHREKIIEIIKDLSH
jgi:perosamine synthetase